MSKLYNVYTTHKGTYKLSYKDVKEPQLNKVIFQLLRNGVQPNKIEISNGYDLNHRKMSIIEGDI